MSAGEVDPALAQSRLRELRARFGASLRERLDRLDSLLEAARSGSAEGALAQALVAAHRLAGTAGTFGHIEAGEAAAALEQALQRIAEGSPDPCASDEPASPHTVWHEAMVAMARLRAAASAPGLG